ncbi:MAG: hypothetical protein K8S25_02035 [Alphaproteobacteria bacterium]|nr:hypothetical protein [Alphaproteobacteria bacterium]
MLYKQVRKLWTTLSKRFKLNPLHHLMGPNTQPMNAASSICNRIATAMLAVVILISAQTATARVTLLPLTECPTDIDPVELCAVRGFVWAGKKEKKAIRRQIGRTTITKTFLVTGRLAGGKPAPYAVKFTQPLSDYFAHTDHTGPVAHVWTEDQAVLLTTRGRLKISTRDIGVESWPGFTIIDRKRWQAIARYYDNCIDLSILNRPNLTTLRDDVRAQCISLADGKAIPGEKSCPRPQKAECNRIPENFQPFELTVEQLYTAVRELRQIRLTRDENEKSQFGGSGNGVSVFSVPNTKYLVVHAFCDECY